MTAVQATQRATLDEAVVDSSALMCILMGDLFTYALARKTALPLFFQDTGPDKMLWMPPSPQ